ncbi:hypothetical protein [Archangium sp.]|jgi:predicted amidohydrolase|uniref:hypothetical protein n=1 Tax=Archangium sp. TaxID=1872627 RepID=UPI002EDA2C73
MEILVALWSRNTRNLHYMNQPLAGASADARMQALSEAIQKVGEKLAAGGFPPGQPIQGIFVAPEYLFTQQRTSSAERRAVEEGMKEGFLQHLLTLSRTYPTLLIVPGTIAWRKPLQRPAGEQRKKDPMTGERTGDEKTESRVAKAQRSFSSSFLPPSFGNFNPGNKNTFNGVEDTVPGKDEKLSKLADWADQDCYIQRNTAYMLLNGRIRFKYNKRGDFHEAIGAHGDTVFIPGQRSGMVTIENIRFALEICLDHWYGMANHDVSLEPTNTPHIHIVASDFVDNRVSRMAMESGGWFLHASSSQAHTGVWTKDSSGTHALPATEMDTVGGEPLCYWRITLDDALCPSAVPLNLPLLDFPEFEEGIDIEALLSEIDSTEPGRKRSWQSLQQFAGTLQAQLQDSQIGRSPKRARILQQFQQLQQFLNTGLGSQGRAQEGAPLQSQKQQFQKWMQSLLKNQED